MTNPKKRPASFWLAPDLIAEIDAQAARMNPVPGAKFSRNAWVAAAIRAALDAARTAPAAPGQTPNQ